MQRILLRTITFAFFAMGCMHSAWSFDNADDRPLQPPATPPTQAQAVREDPPTDPRVVEVTEPFGQGKTTFRQPDFGDDDALDGLSLLFSDMAVQKRYLGLEGIDPSKEKCVISMCPMNSSGDIYHILAYVIVSLGQGKSIPPIMLTFDGSQTQELLESKMNTYSQVERSLQFCGWLGYRTYFNLPPQEIEGDAFYQKVRQRGLIDTLTRDYTHYVDQKALTTIVAAQFRNDRKSTAATLKRGFEEYDQANPDLPKVKQSALTEVENIKHHKGASPLVVMHMRYSSNANETQNPLVDLTSMQKYLEDNGYKVWFMFTDGRVRESFTEIEGKNRTNVFPFPHTTKKYAQPNPAKLDGSVDYGKFYHLQLLLGLLPLENVRFIGNTSGTLDLAGFIGHKVYNMHALAESMNYQTARILIQSAFLAVECLPCKKKESGIALLGDHYDVCHLQGWLTSGAHPVNAHVGDYQSHKQQSGYFELFYARALQNEAHVEIGT